MNLPLPDMSAVQSMLDVVNDPRQLHAALVHVPIAVAALGPVMVLVLTCTGGKSHVLRWTTALLYLAAGVLGWYAAEAGQMAVLYEHAPASRTAEALEVLTEHERLGDIVPLLMAGVGVLLVLTAIPKRLLRVGFLALSLLASVAAAGWVGLTAHHGGQLVYHHGMNTPTTPNNAPPPPSAPRQPSEPQAGTSPAPDPDQPERKRGFFGIPTD
jgi:uncharacterized membrane protein